MPSFYCPPCTACTPIVLHVIAAEQPWLSVAPVLPVAAATSRARLGQVGPATHLPSGCPRGLPSFTPESCTSPDNKGPLDDASRCALCRPPAVFSFAPFRPQLGASACSHHSRGKTCCGVSHLFPCTTATMAERLTLRAVLLMTRTVGGAESITIFPPSHQEKKGAAGGTKGEARTNRTGVGDVRRNSAYRGAAYGSHAKDHSVHAPRASYRLAHPCTRSGQYWASLGG